MVANLPAPTDDEIRRYDYLPGCEISKRFHFRYLRLSSVVSLNFVVIYISYYIFDYVTNQLYLSPVYMSIVDNCLA